MGKNNNKAAAAAATTVLTTTPLIFQSKLLCLSLLYLFSAFLLALFSSTSTKCILRSSSSSSFSLIDPIQIQIQSPLFSYPPSYGEHKYALPIHRPSCSSPVFFSDYAKVLREIQGLSQNSSAFAAGGLTYMHGHGGSWFNTFGGNFSSIHDRISYFHGNNNDSVVQQVPCGFFKDFPITASDKLAMEQCRGVIVVSAIFNNHDKIRQPKGLGSHTLSSVCFFMFVDDATLNELDRHKLIISQQKEENIKIGAWSIVRVSTKDLYQNPAMNGVIPKYLVHRLFPNSKFSIWVDAKLQLVVDPLLLVHSMVVLEDVDMAISKHPYFIHSMEEAMATARWKKWRDIDSLKEQMETYCENGLLPWSPSKLPYPSDVPDSALIIRKHNERSNLFSCLVFNELEAFNPRDQLAFAFVRDLMRLKKKKLKMNMFEVEVLERVAVEYRHNINVKHEEENETLGGGGTSNNSEKLKDNNKKIKKRARSWSSDSSSCPNEGRCQKYLMKLWRESQR